MGNMDPTKTSGPPGHRKSSSESSSPLLTYSSYLKVGELTSLQQPLSTPTAHDEILFIIIHQVYELWFKEIIFELEALIRFLNGDKLLHSFRLLDRICELFDVLIHQIKILETMTPVEFNRFRSHLKPASGFQSRQFREIELLSGLDVVQYQGLVALDPEWKDIVQSFAQRSTLRVAWIELLKRRQLLQTPEREKVIEAVLRIYESMEDPALHNLCEYLIRYDELFSLWRFRHVQMVERMIGMKRGTGGSLGVGYLQTTLKRRFFPELWEARTRMEGATGY